MKTAVIKARIPEQLKMDFEAVAAAHGWNLSEAVQRLMNQYVRQEKELSRRRAETFEALTDVEAGRVIKGDTVLEWLDSWGSEDEPAPPA